MLFTLWPILEILDEYYAHQLENVEKAVERQRIAKHTREQEAPHDCL